MCQLVLNETQFAVHRRTLCLIHPEGIQRSSYFLAMPMRYGAPLMAASTTLKWMISQSMFLVSIVGFYPDWTTAESSYYFYGYSCQAVLVCKLSIV